MPKPPPEVNTGNTVLCEVSLANIVVVMVQPLSSEASASAATSVLPLQDAVLVGEGQPDDFELLFFDDAPEARRRFLLLVGPETVTPDKTQRAPSGRRTRCHHHLTALR